MFACRLVIRKTQRAWAALNQPTAVPVPPAHPLSQSPTSQQLHNDAAQAPDVAGEGPAQAQNDLGRAAAARTDSCMGWVGTLLSCASRRRQLPQGTTHATAGSGRARGQATGGGGQAWHMQRPSMTRVAAVQRPSAPVVPRADNCGVVVSVKGGGAKVYDPNDRAGGQPLADPEGQGMGNRGGTTA